MNIKMIEKMQNILKNASLMGLILMGTSPLLTDAFGGSDGCRYGVYTPDPHAPDAEGKRHCLDIDVKVWRKNYWDPVNYPQQCHDAAQRIAKEENPKEQIELFWQDWNGGIKQNCEDWAKASPLTPPPLKPTKSKR